MYKYVGDRPTLQNWSSVLEKPEAKPGKTMHDWWQKECAYSLDGLPALSTALTMKGTPFRNTWVRPDVRRKDGNDKSMEEYRKRKVGDDTKAAQLAQQQLTKVKSGAAGKEDERVLYGVYGLIGGLLVAMLLKYAGVALA